MTARLATSSLVVDTCSDVYRGLARVCKAPAETYSAVVVCLGALGSAELQFFSTMARARPRVPVYVYGNASDAKREARAIELGAACVFTDDVMSHLETSGASLDTDDSTQEPSPGAQKPAIADRADPRTAASTESLPDRLFDDDPSKPDHDDHPSRPVQVPWLNRAGSPARRKPSKPSKVQDVPERSQSAEESSGRALPEPLLTDEELQALIGDDILSIPSDEHGTGEQNGGGA